MKKTYMNEMKLQFPAKSINESFARSAVAAFAAQCDPNVAIISEIKTFVSEAVTNAIVHAYADEKDKANCPIYIKCFITEEKRLTVKIADKGKGIADIAEAMQPLFTTDIGGERSGMGFTVMESFSDKLKVRSVLGKGTTVTIEKELVTN